jgi:adenosylcobinamide hydrolase
MVSVAVADGVLQARTGPARFLATGFGGGYHRAAAAYNISVPERFERRDLDAYVTERREAAGFEADGPAMLTGVDLAHARGARSGPIAAVATAGVSNPAALPMDASGSDTDGRPDAEASDPWRPGTVNLVVATTRALHDGALATLLGTVTEARTATLLADTGFPGTTTDAAIVGCDLEGEPAAFAGSATPVGAAARACVRDAVRASLASRYPDREFPPSVADAEHGVATTRETELFEP